ncbi:MAG: threonine dehydratase [Arenicella sp.]|jgi:threonine dehydratase
MTTELDNPIAEKSEYFPQISAIQSAHQKLKGIVVHTPLLPNFNLSERFEANVLLKREDLQNVRSYKIRGAYNKMSGLDLAELPNGIVCASAGNHAQGVALSCKLLKIQGTIFMPATTPNQKVEQVRNFGKSFVKIELVGDTFDEAYEASMKFCDSQKSVFIHPFNDEKVIEGQGTVGLEILTDSQEPIDYLILPVGGGGLASGVSTVFKTISPQTKIIGVEPEGAPAMKNSLQLGKNTSLQTIDKFVDGASVMRVGDKAFEICRETIDEVLTVHEGKICQTMLELYNQDAIVVEPAGALSISALDQLADEIKGKTVVCIVSGSNNDITRMEEIKERALLYQGLKHYFIVTFPQRAGALKEFVAEVLGEQDDIVYFEYSKKTSREKGSAVVGIELQSPTDFHPLQQKMKEKGFFGEYLNDKPVLFEFLV